MLSQCHILYELKTFTDLADLIKIIIGIIITGEKIILNGIQIVISALFLLLKIPVITKDMITPNIQNPRAARFRFRKNKIYDIHVNSRHV
jgi:hypothetical protein